VSLTYCTHAHSAQALTTSLRSCTPIDRSIELRKEETQRLAIIHTRWLGLARYTPWQATLNSRTELSHVHKTAFPTEASGFARPKIATKILLHTITTENRGSGERKSHSGVQGKRPSGSLGDEVPEKVKHYCWMNTRFSLHIWTDILLHTRLLFRNSYCTFYNSCYRFCAPKHAILGSGALHMAHTTKTTWAVSNVKTISENISVRFDDHDTLWLVVYMTMERHGHIC